ncbi:hypothetical protein NIES2104_57480 [Leptolyngbya sp. NIES-2104]|nr:hypothetical protein NIES2104_57480 [Leptolyngbya sp. NIES-2104]
MQFVQWLIRCKSDYVYKFLASFTPAPEWNSGLIVRSPLKRTEGLRLGFSLLQ